MVPLLAAKDPFEGDYSYSDGSYLGYGQGILEGGFCHIDEAQR